MILNYKGGLMRVADELRIDEAFEVWYGEYYYEIEEEEYDDSNRNSASLCFAGKGRKAITHGKRNSVTIVRRNQGSSRRAYFSRNSYSPRQRG
jgi:hypothetical protein